MSCITINKHATVSATAIPVVDYNQFYEEVTTLLDAGYHMVSYSGLQVNGYAHFVCALSDFEGETMKLLSYKLNNSTKELQAISALCPDAGVFERTLATQFGIVFKGIPAQYADFCLDHVATTEEPALPFYLQDTVA